MKDMKSVPLNKELYNYILDLFVENDPLLDELVVETEKAEIPLIQVAPEQGKFMYLLCRMMKAKNALEIGTLAGFSGIYIARGLEDGGKLTTVDIEQKNSDFAGAYFEKAGLTNKTERLVGDALKVMEDLVNEGRKFDFIFIDADKISYPKYFELAIALSNKGTVIAFDNMIKDGRVIEDASGDPDLRGIQVTNGIMGTDPRIESLLIPIGDGLTIGVVK
jgi:predicted O-methyltransferase YrrM